MPPVRIQNTALYLHIPFCVRKCPYCAFISHELKRLDQADEVIDTILLEAEFHLLNEPWQSEPVHSLFLGGGTPSILSGAQVQRLIQGLRNRFQFTPDAECTIEVNPGTITAEKIEGWKAAGLNRISLGVQSLHEPTLQRLGRIHSAERARQAFEKLKQAEFSQLSVDLMYGIEVEGALEGWEATVREVTEWHPDHISAYALTIEPGTAFARERDKGGQVKPVEEVEMAQYDIARSVMVAAGYEHYEISNWALPGHRCRHNVSYWDGGSYLALGPAGHSYDAIKKQRFWNESDTLCWLEQVRKKGDGVAGHEALDDVQLYEERLALDLRMVDGASEEVARQYAKRAGKSWPPVILETLIREGLLERQGGLLRYTERGHHLADELEVQLIK